MGGITKLSLEHCGYEVRTVRNGQEALRAFATSPCAFDLVILDQEMPDLKGTEVAEKLTSLRPGMPILLYTGCQDSDLTAVAQAAGITDIAVKSLAIEDLLHMVDKAFNFKEAPQEYSGLPI